MSRADRLSALVLAFWAGGLWTVCGMVVPALFWLIEDSKLAGNLAAQLFYGETFLGVLFGLIYWALQRGKLDAVSSRCVWIAMTAPLVFFVVLRPLMNAARSSGDMARFGQLHGLASVLFLTACFAAGVPVWRPRIRRPAG